MFRGCIRRALKISKVNQIWSRGIDFYDKGRAEENVFFLKRQEEDLERLRRKLNHKKKRLEQQLEQTKKELEKMKEKDDTKK